jgi:polyhydroxyalkanoate synthesis regulator phasin
MILELNRAIQRSNGKVPAQQQTKIQKIVNENELQRTSMRDKSRVSSRSNSISHKLLGVTPNKEIAQ